jgi:peroxiredoxin family protein
MKLEDIRTDGDTQARTTLNQETVNEYAQQIQDGAIFPPVVVFNDGANNWLADGFHRYYAHRQNGSIEIDVEIHNGTVDDATLYAFGATAKRGLSFTKEDMAEIVGRMIKHPVWGTWSTRKIAEHIGCSAMTISRIRSSFEDAPKKVSYTRNGEEKTMDTSAIGKAPRKPKDKADIEDTIKELREQLRVKDVEILALKESRDMYQNENAELKRTVKSLQAKLKKVEG